MPTAKKAEAAKKNSPLTDKAQSAAHETIDKAAARASAAEESIRDAVESQSENFAGKKATMELEMETAANQARTFVIENPLMAAGIAFGAGMLISSLFGRR